MEIKKLLDAGAQTLLVPFVQCAEEARQGVAAATDPPNGIPGVSGITRATRYGSVQGDAIKARHDICLLLQMETRIALDRLDEIAIVEGTDGLFVGPADLAAMKRLRALGVPSGIIAALLRKFLRGFTS